MEDVKSAQCGSQPGISIGIWLDTELDVKHSTSALSASDVIKKAARTERNDQL